MVQSTERAAIWDCGCKRKHFVVWARKTEPLPVERRCLCGNTVRVHPGGTVEQVDPLRRGEGK